ncbi:MAG: MBL fold metallo-hydrolase [Chloroflexota bacterium]|nr:MBL fold metallo-hydrolase [Chloroflexota bacterium]MDE2894241.1 MBL fold metallo-hydrolase [Chloroflexota bacterium]
MRPQTISRVIRQALTLLIAPVLALMPQRVSLRLLERAVIRNQARDALADLPDGIHVLLCGAGGPLPDINRSGPCVAVQAGRHLYVIDAGTNGARNLGRFGVSVGRVEALLLTHAHSDHIDGLGELGVLRWVTSGSEQPLPVHGPSVVEDVVTGFNRAYAADAAYRTAHHGTEIAPPNGCGLNATPFSMPEDSELQLVLENDDGVRISAFSVSHAPVCEAVGYRIDYRGRAIVVSGDTAYSENLVRQAQGVDLLVHDALANSMTERIATAAESTGNTRAARIMRDVPSYHATPVQAARAAAEAGARQLLLYHIVPALPSAAFERVFLDGVRNVYDGQVTLGRDGTLISLPADQG